MKTYNKLVRDKIPEIIKSNGENPVFRKLSDNEFAQQLKCKLQEEVEEFLVDDNIEELADIVEVIHGILSSKSTTFNELETVRKEKFDKKGGFENKVFLEGVEKGR